MVVPHLIAGMYEADDVKVSKMCLLDQEGIINSIGEKIFNNLKS